MANTSFRRGIHPPESKMTSDLPIRQILPKLGAVMVYPMIQHIGVPCEPIVEIGDEVCAGQKIAESTHGLSSVIHSSVSGIVKDIRITLSPRGVRCKGIFIENDDKYTEHPSIQPNADYKAKNRDELITIIREAGIVGLGGAGFPAHIKLNPPPDKKIDTIFINAAECEPYLTTDHRVLLEETEKILMGLDILLHMFPEAGAIIAIEDNKPDAVEKFNKLNKNERVTVMTLVTKYPQGAERQVVYACTGKEVPSGGLPLDVGCLVHNVDTVIAIQQAVVNGMPLMRKVITVTGEAASNPGNYEVRLGMTFSDLLEASGGGFTSEPYKIVVGGPMMGVAQYTLDIPVIKISSALLLLTKEEALKPPSENCFRCGKCVDHCPMGLVPLDLNYYADKGDGKRFRKFNGLDCIWCACCSYICPAHRNLAQSIYIMRQEILDSR